MEDEFIQQMENDFIPRMEKMLADEIKHKEFMVTTKKMIDDNWRYYTKSLFQFFKNGYFNDKKYDQYLERSNSMIEHLQIRIKEYNEYVILNK